MKFCMNAKESLQHPFSSSLGWQNLIMAIGARFKQRKGIEWISRHPETPLARKKESIFFFHFNIYYHI